MPTSTSAAAFRALPDVALLRPAGAFALPAVSVPTGLRSSHEAELGMRWYGTTLPGGRPVACTRAALAAAA